MEERIEFSNSTIKHNTLPHIEQLSFEPLSSNYRKTNFIVNLVILIFLSSALAFLKLQTLFEIPKAINNTLLVILSIFSVIILIRLVYKLLADSRKKYSLREQDLSYSSGLLFKKIVTQPILRIQHVELKQGPIDRKVDLAKVQVFSAGGALHTFEIPGLTLSCAESIRQFILDHKDVNNHG